MSNVEINEAYMLHEGKFFARGSILDIKFKGSSIQYLFESLYNPDTFKILSDGNNLLKHIHVVSISAVKKEYPWIIDVDGDLVSCYCGQLTGTDIDSIDDVTVCHFFLLL